jgi:hypothetical protein
MADVLNNFQLDKRGAKKEISKLISCAAPFSKSSIVFSENQQKSPFCFIFDFIRTSRITLRKFMSIYVNGKRRRFTNIRPEI